MSKRSMVVCFGRLMSWLSVFCVTIWNPFSFAVSGAAIELDRSPYVGYKSSSGLRVILSAPHGGEIYPKTIPDRDVGCWNSSTEQCVWSHDCGEKNASKCKAITVDDHYTQEMTGELRARLCELFFGFCPAAVFNLLGRPKFDANRDRDEATFGVAEVVKAFEDYHALIEKEITTMGGFGLFVDIHGHGHKEQRAELGYLVRGNVLDSGKPVDPNTTSIRSIAHKVRLDFDQLLRGNESFGGILGEFGFDSVPSPKYRGPGNLTYFNGGYNTKRHGSFFNGSFDALQIESARSHREPAVRPRYVKALACTIKRFYCLYYLQAPPVSVRVQRSPDRLADACAKDDEACKAEAGISNFKTAMVPEVYFMAVICIYMSLN